MKKKFDKYCKKNLEMTNLEKHLTLVNDKQVFKFSYYVEFMDVMYYWKRIRIDQYVEHVRRERRKVLFKNLTDKDKSSGYEAISQQPMDVLQEYHEVTHCLEDIECMVVQDVVKCMLLKLGGLPPEILGNSNFLYMEDPKKVELLEANKKKISQLAQEALVDPTRLDFSVEKVQNMHKDRIYEIMTLHMETIQQQCKEHKQLHEQCSKLSGKVQTKAIRKYEMMGTCKDDLMLDVVWWRSNGKIEYADIADEL